MINFIQKIDTALLLFVKTNLSHPCLYFLMLLITQLGSSIFVILLGLTLLGLKPKERRTGILILSSYLPSQLICITLKAWIARPRPTIFVSNLSFLNEMWGFAFPSAHSTTAFALAIVLGAQYFRYRWIFMTLACLVGTSRIFLGVHYPSDVLAGAFLGITIGALVSFSANKYLAKKKGVGLSETDINHPDIEHN